MPTSTAATVEVSLNQVRAWWSQRQGLAGPEYANPSSAIHQTGFIRALGGADVYLALRTRYPALTREQLDQTVRTRQAQVIPAVRGCIYLVDKKHVPLLLRFAEGLWRKRTDRELSKVDVAWSEIEAVGAAVLTVLDEGPKTPHALRKILPDGVVRSLGEAGKKIGLSSTLPTALRMLEFAGKIERLTETGRLDTERYVWGKVERDPFAGLSLPADADALVAQIASLFFRQVIAEQIGHASCYALDTEDALRRRVEAVRALQTQR